MWAASDMETFNTWTHEVRFSCTLLHLHLVGMGMPGADANEQLDSRQDLDIRNPSVHTAQYTWVTDYLVGCHMSDTSGLGVFVGSNEYALAPPLHHTDQLIPF